MCNIGSEISSYNNLPGFMKTFIELFLNVCTYITLMSILSLRARRNKDKKDGKKFKR